MVWLQASGFRLLPLIARAKRAGRLTPAAGAPRRASYSFFFSSSFGSSCLRTFDPSLMSRNDRKGPVTIS